MPDDPRRPAIRWLFLSLCLATSWHQAAGSLGDGRRMWQKPKPVPVSLEESFLRDTFPPGFLWGAGTSAFQTEGSWDRDGKGASVWDKFTQWKAADVAADSFARWEEDLRALEYLGVKSYSFSLSWPRLFPDGRARGPPSQPAVEHYNRLINGLLQKRIEPVVTIHHWDLPLVLQEVYGGWKNDSLVGFFEDYAAFCFRTFGDRVGYWLTMHNPYLVAAQGYGAGVHAPGETGGDAAALIVAHNLIRAHAKAWHIYDAHYRPAQKGHVSIVLGSHWVEPPKGQQPIAAAAAAAAVDLCQQSMEAVLGWFANPILGDGDYPPSLKVKHGGLLPAFSAEEKLRVKNTADFFALSFGPNVLRLGRSLPHLGQNVSPDLRRVLAWIKLEYGDLPVLLAEVGWFSEASVGIEDTVALYLMKRFINQALQAVRWDGVRLLGYTAWSLLDGFEWNYGYSVRRGLFYVDFAHPESGRTPKTSAQFYRRVIADDGFPRAEPSPEVEGHFPCDFQWGIADSTLEVRFFPFSPQFTDPHVYSWNRTGDGSLRAVPGLKLHANRSQCTDFLAVRDHVALFASTGATHYRFALNWSLILPRGDLSDVNVEALRYYRCVLSELQKLDLEATVILYYPTRKAPNLGLPGALHASGGWLNSSTADAFRDYAALCYRELGPRVRYWITVNEPNRLTDLYSGGDRRRLAARHLLAAHAKAWRLHEREYARRRASRASLALHADWAEPANPFLLKSHAAAVDRFLLFELGRFLDPLLRPGYEGEGALRIPFSKSEREELRGALSFIALNHFTTRLVSPFPDNVRPKDAGERGCLVLSDPTWPSSGLGQALVPWGLRKVLTWVTERYGPALPVVVTASGVDDRDPVRDGTRQHYLKSYLREALKALRLDGVNLRGFYVWKLQDDLAPQYGLFSSTEQQSKAKASVDVYRQIIARNGFPRDAGSNPCRSTEARPPCSLCAWLSENKALAVFGCCLVLTAVIFAVLAFSAVVNGRKYNGGRRRRGRAALVHSCGGPAVKRTPCAVH
ncbi:beta-klotho [Syngnathoides biaculeatus]|uniref:beta-klotho n=1 Tax=Syngnathoides biaculeatus TaxID=300417 RepID=UPI002ADDA486|nr:beta-klotho [Syngnathoides biaculeatus]